MTKDWGLPTRKSRHVDIAASREVHAAISMAVRRCVAVRITGHSGTGKSLALKHHALEFDAEYFECTGYQKNIRGLFAMLYGSGGSSLQTARLVQAVTSHFESLQWGRRQKPLLIDEWQTLELPAQRELLRLADKYEIPMVLAGNPDALFSGRKYRASLEQINSRIRGGGEFYTYPLSEADCLSICIDRNIEGQDARRLVTFMSTKLDFRELNGFLEEAAVMTGGAGSIRLNHLEMAILSLAGSPDKAKALMKPQEEQ